MNQIQITMKSLYKHYEGLPIEEVVRLELNGHGLTEDDLTEEQLEQFKEEMIYLMNGGTMLDGVLTEVYPYSVNRRDRILNEIFKNAQ